MVTMMTSEYSGSGIQRMDEGMQDASGGRRAGCIRREEGRMHQAGGGQDASGRGHRVLGYSYLTWGTFNQRLL